MPDSKKLSACTYAVGMTQPAPRTGAGAMQFCIAHTSDVAGIKRSGVSNREVTCSFVRACVKAVCMRLSIPRLPFLLVPKGFEK